LVFKDRAACCCRDCVLPSCSLLRCTPFNLGGCILYFEAAFLSSGRCRCLPPLRLVWFQHRAVALCFFPARGAEPTSFPRLLSTRFVDSFFHPVPACRLRDFPFRGEAASTTTALGVNFARRLSISSFTSFVRSSWPPLRPRFPSEGRGFYHRRLWSQPPSPTLFFPCPGFVAVATSALSWGRGFYHHRAKSQLRPANSVFRLQPVQVFPPPMRFRLPVRGARLLPPPRPESTRFFYSFFPVPRLGARVASSFSGPRQQPPPLPNAESGVLSTTPQLGSSTPRVQNQNEPSHAALPARSAEWEARDGSLPRRERDLAQGLVRHPPSIHRLPEAP
jgi:hypothetical protein